MSWDTDLTGRALAIAGCEDSPLRVTAGPGTGKTFAMKRYVARLLEEGVSPNRILAVTFTRVAAADVERELHAMDIPGCENIRAGTLHAYCFSLLRRQNVLDFVGRVARPLVSFSKKRVLQCEAAPLLADVIPKSDFGGKRDCSKRILAFEAAWARLQSDDPGWPSDPVDNQFHHELINWLSFHESMLIGEVVPEALRYLRSNPNAPELGAFDYVIVDEYQDLNKAEQVLIDLLASNASLFIVGDADQSIYSFRHAHPEGIDEFAETHTNTHDEELIECRRCPKRVVRIADRLIQQNHLQAPGSRLTIYDDNPQGDIHIVQWGDLDEESEGLSKYIDHLITQEGYEPGDILVLSPRRLMGYSIRDRLSEQNIPAHSYYHEKILEADEAQLALSSLTLLDDKEDRTALRFWLGFSSPSWRSGQYSVLRNHCENSGLSPWAVLEQLESGGLTLGRTNQLVSRFQDLRALIDSFEDLEGEELLDAVFSPNAEWAESIRESVSPSVDDETDVSALLEIVSRLVTQPESPEEGEFVRIMSLHKSKGLTSKVVIVAGCIEGLIPTIDQDATPADRENALQEQRRLFYVSITRCEEILVLSSISSLDESMAYQLGARFTGRGGNVRTITSRFMQQLGPHAPIAKSGSNWEDGGYG